MTGDAKPSATASKSVIEPVPLVAPPTVAEPETETLDSAIAPEAIRTGVADDVADTDASVGEPEATTTGDADDVVVTDESVGEPAATTTGDAVDDEDTEASVIAPVAVTLAGVPLDDSSVSSIGSDQRLQSIDGRLRRRDLLVECVQRRRVSYREGVRARVVE